MLINLTKENFKKEVLESNIPVVVDFYADWCMPCQVLKPIMEKLSNEYEGKVKFCAFNIEEDRKTAMEYKILGIPALVFFKDGKSVDFIGGIVKKEVIEQSLNKLI